MKTALVIRHVPHEGVAGFRLPIEQAGYGIERVDVTDPGFDRIDLVAPDLVVMMGGPMAVYERDANPWIGCELARLAERLAVWRPTLGVCLGSQMIAAALGAQVQAGPVKEVGFAPVTLTEAGRASPVAHFAGVPVLHFHGDTFALPEGAELLAHTQHYAQAFRVGPNVLALQCHPEMGEDPRITNWVEGSDAYLAEAGTTGDAVLRDYAALGPGAVTAGRRLVRDWLAGLDAETGSSIRTEALALASPGAACP